MWLTIDFRSVFAFLFGPSGSSCESSADAESTSTCTAGGTKRLGVVCLWVQLTQGMHRKWSRRCHTLFPNCLYYLELRHRGVDSHLPVDVPERSRSYLRSVCYSLWILYRFLCFTCVLLRCGPPVLVMLRFSVVLPPCSASSREDVCQHCSLGTLNGILSCPLLVIVRFGADCPHGSAYSGVATRSW